MTDPAAIARAMTKTQRRVVLLGKADWAIPDECGLGPYSRQAIYNAERFKVIEIGSNRFRLTPLGAQVRAVLEAQQIDGGVQESKKKPRRSNRGAEVARRVGLSVRDPMPLPANSARGLHEPDDQITFAES